MLVPSCQFGSGPRVPAEPALLLIASRQCMYDGQPCSVNAAGPQNPTAATYKWTEATGHAPFHMHRATLNGVHGAIITGSTSSQSFKVFSSSQVPYTQYNACGVWQVVNNFTTMYEVRGVIHLSSPLIRTMLLPVFNNAALM